MPGSPAFDRYVMVDWSARAVPATGRDSIWIADHRHGRPTRLVNPPTRAGALDELRRIVDDGERTLIGVDVTFGYPAGTAAASGLEGPAWAATWRYLAAEVVDGPRNGNNRFVVADRWNRRLGDGPGPFWGCPAGAATAALPVRKPVPFPAPERRACERWLHAAGRRPFSVWQLGGAGSVGGQALTAIPVLHALRDAHPSIAVWPFTTGWELPAGAAVVLAEVWPSAFPVDRATHPVKDAAQVLSVVAAWALADAGGELAGWFRPPPGVDQHDLADAVEEEAWVMVPPTAG